MAYNNYNPGPFWNFGRGFGQNGAGVDHAVPGYEQHGFEHPPPPPPGLGTPGGPPPPPPPPPPYAGWGAPFMFPREPHGFGFGFGGPPPHGHGGPRGGRRGRRDRERNASGEEEDHPRSRTASPSGREGEGGDNKEGGAEGGRTPRGPRGCRGRGGSHGRGGWGGHHGRRGPPPFGGMGGGFGGGFDMRGLLDSLNNQPWANHPWAQAMRHYLDQAGLGGGFAQRDGEVDAEESFVPPVDIFSTETAFILHIALPGAKKEDVGVNWDAEKGVLNVAGVIYRQGDEEFLKTLSQSERKVGMFDRSIKLPPGIEEQEDVNADAITAKLEDGVLVVTVPKIEKEWTEVKRVDIE